VAFHGGRGIQPSIGKTRSLVGRHYSILVIGILQAKNCAVSAIRRLRHTLLTAQLDALLTARLDAPVLRRPFTDNLRFHRYFCCDAEQPVATHFPRGINVARQYS
jgi:hypothetical protein